MKTLYRADDKTAAEKALDTFMNTWQKRYPKVTQSLKDHSDLFIFYDFPKAIWRSIYSINLIESFNKRIKRYSKRKEQFPNEASLDRFLVAQFEDYNQQFSTRCHIGFDKARAEIIEMFNQ